jgi:hypothetical protein
MRKQTRGRSTRSRTTSASSTIPAKERARRQAWANRWFEGTPRCPRCGANNVRYLGTHSGGDTRLEEWQCSQPRCPARWRLEVRETALAILDPETRGLGDWYERTKQAPTFHIVVKNNAVQGIHIPPGSPMPEILPRFRVREYPETSNEHPLTGVDHAGRGYYERELPLLGDDE